MTIWILIVLAREQKAIVKKQILVCYFWYTESILMMVIFIKTNFTELPNSTFP